VPRTDDSFKYLFELNVDKREASFVGSGYYWTIFNILKKMIETQAKICAVKQTNQLWICAVKH
jgi:hypothetical protein